jgi:hypothetical protein
MTRSVHFSLALLALAALSRAEGTVSWQQVGGSLSIDPTFKGIVGQGYTTPVQDGGTTVVQSGFLAHPLLVNNAPFVVSSLSDLVLPAGFASTSLNLDTVFADIEGTLVYSVAVTGTGTTATVSGSTLAFAGVAGSGGVAQLVVSATDGTYSVSDTFTVTTQLSTGIAARTPVALVTNALAVGLPRIFASQATGAGRGELGTASVSDEAHSLAVNLLLPSAGTISVQIFDQIGTPVISLSRTVTAQELVGLEPSGDGRRVLPVTWNLRAANGAAVGAGVYLWKIELQTVDGQKLESVKRLGVKGTK